MVKKATTTTPDPELSTPLGTTEPDKGKSPDDPQAQQPEQSGGGGAPETGSESADEELPLSAEFSPGEGVNEEQRKRSGLDD
ncbi:MAG: hypothetical protein ACJ8FY_08810 [Gemmataceae bacterium]